ncbi:MAG: hypothetical protein AB7V18_20570 [Pyrinomonadaceae bacterium]
MADWKSLGGSLIKAGAPIIGSALGGPLGGLIGSGLGDVLASALGVEATPEAVSNAIVNGDPATVSAALSAADQKAIAEYSYLTELAKAQADVDKTQIEAVNETIRVEAQAAAARPDGWWGNWRTIMAYELTIECPFWAGLIAYCVVAGKMNELIGATSILVTWWGARFGVLGVHVWTGSNERQTAITGQAKPSVIEKVVKAVRGK